MAFSSPNTSSTTGTSESSSSCQRASKRDYDTLGWRVPYRPSWAKYPRPLDASGLFDNPETVPRRWIIYTATSFSAIALVLITLVMLGSISDQPVLNRIYFLKLDLSNLVPSWVPNYGHINSIAQSLGLRDYYQVGLWGYCEGYYGRGISRCSKPKHWFWFNPVEIITHQLLRGAKIALPQDIALPLDLARAASYWMYVCWVVSMAFTLLSICTGWMAIYSHLAAGFTGAVVGIAMTSTMIAAATATTVYSLFRSTFEKAPEVTISGILGQEMFVYMWMASGFLLGAFVLHCAMCCGMRTEKGYRKRRAREELATR